MGLIKCADCGKKVSERATACPECGAPIVPAEVKKEKQEKKLGCLFVLLIMLGLTVWFVIDAKRDAKEYWAVGHYMKVAAPGCISEDYLDRMYRYLNNDEDEFAARLVSDNKCVILPTDMKVEFYRTEQDSERGNRDNVVVGIRGGAVKLWIRHENLGYVEGEWF